MFRAWFHHVLAKRWKKDRAPQGRGLVSAMYSSCFRDVYVLIWSRFRLPGLFLAQMRAAQRFLRPRFLLASVPDLFADDPFLGLTNSLARARWGNAGDVSAAPRFWSWPATPAEAEGQSGRPLARQAQRARQDGEGAGAAGKRRGAKGRGGGLGHHRDNYTRNA